MHRGPGIELQIGEKQAELHVAQLIASGHDGLA
jgi:hypothetical protein